MSVVMDFRKSELVADRPHEAESQVAAAPPRVHRLTVLAALLLAGLILAVFNSGALVTYSYTLSEKPGGVQVLEVSEVWHEMMQEKNLTSLVDTIRTGVATAREASWEDLKTLTLGLIEGAGERLETAANADPAEAEVNAAGLTRP